MYEKLFKDLLLSVDVLKLVCCNKNMNKVVSAQFNMFCRFVHVSNKFNTYTNLQIPISSQRKSRGPFSVFVKVPGYLPYDLNDAGSPAFPILTARVRGPLLPQLLEQLYNKNKYFNH